MIPSGHSISGKYSENLPKSKVIFKKSTFWMTPKCHTFQIFLEMVRSNVVFIDIDTVTAYLRHIALHYSKYLATVISYKAYTLSWMYIGI